MGALVAFYSRTGTTKKVAEAVSEELKCDVEEIVDPKNRIGDDVQKKVFRSKTREFCERLLQATSS